VPHLPGRIHTVVFDTTMPDTAWEEYCEASLDLSNQDDVGDPVEEPFDLDDVSNEGD